VHRILAGDHHRGSSQGDNRGNVKQNGHNTVLTA
jgi:hypothetical protein